MKSYYYYLLVALGVLMVAFACSELASGTGAYTSITALLVIVCGGLVTYLGLKI